MIFDPSRVPDPAYFAENRLPAHSDHRWFGSADEVATGVSRYEQSLNGVWQFHYATNLAGTTPGFADPAYDVSGWDDIPVPSHIQLQGYGVPQYVNVQYPWDGYEPIGPGEVPTRFNPVGEYVRTFRLDRPPAPGERVSVTFHGAESAIAVWCNGTYIGYATDSFTPSEFDLTDVLVDGDNRLAAQVFTWSGASWIEDQDMFRFSGLFRDVVLYRKPPCHAEDVSVWCEVADDFSQADVHVDVRLSAPGTVRAVLGGATEPVLGGHPLPHHPDPLPRHPDPLPRQSALLRHPAEGRISLVPEYRAHSAEILIRRKPARAGFPPFPHGGGTPPEQLPGGRMTGEAGRMTGKDGRTTPERELDAGGAAGGPGLRRDDEGAGTPSVEHRVGHTEPSPLSDVRPAYIAHLTIPVPSPHLWSAEDPYLYDLTLTVADDRGDTSEVIPLRVGVRRFGLVSGVMTLNGRRIVFNGVNRHEFGASGRVMSREQTEADIQALKRIGVNALRTCHYPNNRFLYELADEYGLYVIDEMNLESHGLWDRLRTPGATIADAVPGDRPEWRAPLLDRAASMVERDKNHPCILLWSCGNESYGGTNILAVSTYFRERDPRRLVHYEGVYWDPRYPETTDVTSHMYDSAARVEEYLQTHRDKPFLLCEYAHSMGNSFGAVHKYVDLAWREPLFQGGFIWDFADQAIGLRDRYGRAYWGYGGDFGDRPNDAEFSGDGLFFADHSPSPKVQEVRWVYQGFRTVIGDDTFTVTNRHAFTTTSAYDCVVSVAREGTVLAEGRVETAVAPGESGTYPLPVAIPDAPGEYTIDVSYRLRTATPWAPAGYEVGWQQRVIRVDAPPAVIPANAGTPGTLSVDPTPGASPRDPTPGALTTDPAAAPPYPELIQGIHNIGVRGPYFTTLFSRVRGGLTSYRFGPRPGPADELLRSIPKPNFWHAPTSNETGWGMPYRDGGWLLASRYAGADPTGPTAEDHGAYVEVTYRYTLPTSPPSDSTLSYRVYGNGRIEVHLGVTPGEGLPDMPECGVMMMTDADLHRLRWYGEGPEECYADRRLGARLGVYEGDVAAQLTPYLRPQEAGSHTGVRWAELTDDTGRGLRFKSLTPDGMEFSALPWTPFEIENAAHPNDLPPILHTVVRPALARRGVGGDDSWGAMTHPEYCLPAGQPLSFAFAFQGLLPPGARTIR